MAKRRLVEILFILALMFMHACTSNGTDENKQISTDVIGNPVSAAGNYEHDDVPQIAFDKKSHDFNLILQGEVVSYTFRFTNTGSQNLVLADVSSSCGCTVPTYSRKPIKPGDQGTIEVVFNSERREGTQSKKVFVLSNAQPSRDTLDITANIVIPTEY